MTHTQPPTTDRPRTAADRARPPRLALETTLLAHGVPPGHGLPLADALGAIARAEGAEPALVGIMAGVSIVGLSQPQLARLLEADPIKVNTSNLGLALHRRLDAATTVSTTIELAAAQGIRVFSTGGIGGVHRGLADRLDISSDLAAMARFPVAVVASGVKSILDVASTREALETLGVPVVGFRTDRFPAFYLREVPADPGPDGRPIGGSAARVGVDDRFDDAADLAGFLHAEMVRTGRGVLVVNPIPAEHELPIAAWRTWLAAAEARVGGGGSPIAADGRLATPALLAALHEVSAGATLRANIELVKSNVRLGAQLAARWPT